jgi:predicted nucleic acid-binding protein
VQVFVVKKRQLDNQGLTSKSDRLLDTQLAATLHSNGIRRLLTSNPADFAAFGALEIVAP